MKKKFRMAAMLLSMVLLFCGCGDSESASSDTAVSENISAQVLSPTESITPTPSPSPTPTPKPKEDSVSADAVSGNAVSENEATPTEAEKDPEVDLSKLTVFEEHRTMYVTSDNGVNIRKGPSAAYERLGMLNFGTAIEVTGQDAGGWYQFVHGDGFAFVCDQYVSDTPPATPTEVPPTPTLTPEQQAAATPTPVPAAQPVAAPAGVLMIGDSRCVMMREATGGGGVSWICENGKEYEWFKATAIPQAEGIIGRGTKVVICLGVNDADHAYSYSALINQKAAEWAARGAKTYFVSVNPVGGNPWTSMDDVLNFNSIMIRELAGVPYIDTCTWLQQTGYMMIDGMHFDNDTSIRIFNQIMANLR